MDRRTGLRCRGFGVRVSAPMRRGAAPYADASWLWEKAFTHTSTGAVIRFVVVDTGLYLSLGAERRALRSIQFRTIWGSKLQNQFNLIWYGLTRFTKVNGLI